MKEESVVSEELMWKSGKVAEVYEVDGKFESWMLPMVPMSFQMLGPQQEDRTA